MKYANILSHEIRDELPKQIGSTYSPDTKQLSAAGWREIGGIESPKAGWLVSAWNIVEDNAYFCHLTIASQYDPVAAELARQAAQKAALIAMLTVRDKAIAKDYRDTLRKHFGSTAETDPNVTVDSAADLFISKKNAGNIKAQDIADFYALDRLHDMLMKFCPDGTTRSFPWEVLDQ